MASLLPTPMLTSESALAALAKGGGEEGAVRVAGDFDIDLFTQMSGRTHPDLLGLSEPHEVGGQTARFLGAEGLPLLEGDSRRPRDQTDAHARRQLLAGREHDT